MKKLTYEYVKSFIEKEGYVLLSNEYIGNMCKLRLKCKHDHLYEVSFSNFQQGKRCPVCSNNNRKLPFSNIKSFIEKEGFVLLTDNYLNSTKQILNIKCKNGHVFKRSFNGFQQGYKCPICANDNKKLSYDYVKDFIEKDGYLLLSKEYIDCKKKLKIECTNHHQFKMTFSNFKLGHRCPLCVRITSIDEKNIVDYVKNIYNGKVIENDRTLIINPITNRMLELDIYLPDLNKAIEYNGVYWHSKPNAIEKDNIKNEQCKQKGIDLLVVDEMFWKNDNIKCLENIRKFINVI
jgi:hypothetical protein